MRAKMIVSLTVLVVLAGVAFAFYRFSVNSHPAAGTLELEHFANQSAKEVENPLAGSSSTSSTSSSVAAVCPGSQTFDCYEAYYKGIVRSKGIPAAFADLKGRYDTTPYVKAQCHPLTHIIGQAAVDKYPEVSEAYTHGDSFCWSGYYHGVMEGIAAKLGEEKLLADLNGICAGIPDKDKYGFNYYNCVHGLGHGLMALTDDELFDSLKLCDKLQGSWEKQSCYGGVFMENVIVDNKNHFTKYLKPAEPLYPCTAVDDQYKNTCYLMQTSYALKVLNGDFSKVFEICSKVEGLFRSTCYQSLGRDASGRSSSDVAATKATCELGKDYDQQSNCVIGAVKDFVSYFHSDMQAKQLCASLTPDLKDVCIQTAESYYESFK